MPSLGIPAKVLSGIIVQSQTLNIPTGILGSGPTCETSPENCCECCPGTTFPNTLWVTISTEDVACECLPVCVELIYDAIGDDWSSIVIDDLCEDSGLYFRLKCISGSYHFDLMSAGDVLVLAGTVTLGNCDPTYMVVEFDDSTENVVCGGQFTATIGEADCNDPPPTPITTACCPSDPTPVTLYLTFTDGDGNCSCLNGTTIPLVYVTATSKWEWAGVLCGAGASIEFHCADPEWLLLITGPLGADGHSELQVSCAPFLWSERVPGPMGGLCTGPTGALCTISEVAP